MTHIKTVGQIICRAMLFITICGLIGWCYETILTSLIWGRFCGFFARGLLHLPVCPIYGFFALLLCTLFRIPFLQKCTGIQLAVAVFLTGTLVSTGLELVCTYLLEIALDMTLWSYADWPLHFQGRISLLSSLLFGALSLLLFFGVLPLWKRLKARCNPRTLVLAGIVCAAVLGIDLLITLGNR